MSAAQQLATFQMIAVSSLTESPLNPRRSFDEEKLAELTESVREKGVLEPLLVRPLGVTGEAFEVAAGARRFRAAKAAKLVQVPCMVREMSDAELLEVALLENVVRHDISALDEGDAYRALVKEHGYTVEQLVEKTGKSRTVVFARMKLASLEGEGRKLLTVGKLSASVAELVARLPTAKAQEDALKLLEKKKHYRVEHLGEMPVRDARAILDEEFRLPLKKAPFDTKDAELLAAAGACIVCPKRTGASKELFPGVKEDTCLDAACWGKKKSAGFKALQAELADAGKTLVKEKQVFTETYDGSKVLAGAAANKYAKATDAVVGTYKASGASQESWKDLLGKETPLVTVLDERDNSTHNLVDKAAALALLAAKDPKKAEKLKKALETPPEEDWRARQAKDEKKRRQERLVQRLATKAVMGKLASKTLTDGVELLLLALSEDSWSWANTLRAAGLPEKTTAAKLKPSDRVKVLYAAALTVSRWAVLDEAAKATKVDLKAVRKQVAGAEKGACVACGATGEKTGWTDDTQLLCTKCDGEE